MTYRPDDARAYIASVRWQFASTMPRIPHWYTIRKWRPELDGAFVAFVRHIRSAGVRMDWPDPPAKPLYHNQYLLLDGWKYWTMGDPHPGVIPPMETPETTTLINRARIEPQVEDRTYPLHPGADHVPAAQDEPSPNRKRNPWAGYYTSGGLGPPQKADTHDKAKVPLGEVDAVTGRVPSSS